MSPTDQKRFLNMSRCCLTNAMFLVSLSQSDRYNWRAGKGRESSRQLYNNKLQLSLAEIRREAAEGQEDAQVRKLIGFEVVAIVSGLGLPFLTCLLTTWVALHLFQDVLQM